MTNDLLVVMPLACLGVGAFGVYLVARLTQARNAVLATLTAICFAAALVAQLILWRSMGQQMGVFFPTWGIVSSDAAFLRADPGALFIASIGVALGLLVAVYSGRYISLDQRYETYYPLLLLLVTGLVGMVLAADLFNLYLFCELMGIASYTLVSFRRRTDTAIEAGFKYLIMGSVGTVTLLLGISFLYRSTGSLSLTLPDAFDIDIWQRVGLVCVLIGLGVKSALVPLHMWLPDAHGRAPSSISAMLSGIVIQSTFYVLLKVTLGLGFPAVDLGTVLIGLAVIGMITGNLLGLVQTNGKRLLAYSSIANMGYILLSMGMGLRFGIEQAIQAGLFLILVHAAMKGLAFLSKGACHFYCNATELSELRGTYQRLPMAAVPFGIALASLGAIPPLSGFTAKWLVLQASLRTTEPLGIAVLVFFLLNTVLALGYYLPVLSLLFQPSESSESFRVSRWMSAPMLVLSGLVILMGFYPNPWLRWLESSALYLMSLGGGLP